MKAATSQTSLLNIDPSCFRGRVGGGTISDMCFPECMQKPSAMIRLVMKTKRNSTKEKNTTSRSTTVRYQMTVRCAPARL